MSHVTQLTHNHDRLLLNGDMLIYRYPAGDIDCVPWPLKCEFRSETEVNHQLASCLYDERECGGWDGHHVLLPDGTKFYPEEHLVDTPRQYEF